MAWKSVALMAALVFSLEALTAFDTAMPAVHLTRFMASA
jgi:hypothetical protein